ncbi:MAG: hypothetical protein QNJ97_25410 [Myxococcota bacterium]|nr:hypothetical protein [Myxococcota bacterium]
MKIFERALNLTSFVRGQYHRDDALKRNRYSFGNIFIVSIVLFSSCSRTENRQIIVNEDYDPSSGDQTDNNIIPDDPIPDDETIVYHDLPKASENFVYSLNPNAGSVTVINAQQVTIQVVETGSKPTFIEIIEGTDDAIVLNIGSDDATIIRINQNGIAIANNLEVVHGANTLSISPDGQHMVVYFNAERQDFSGTFGDFQTVSVLSFADGNQTTTSMSVGFKPRDVFYNEDGSKAYVVTDDGVSVLDFESVAINGPGIAENINFVSGNYSEDVEQFMITPDGAYAIIKKWWFDSIDMVDLQQNIEFSLEISGFFKTHYHTGEIYWDGILLTPISIKDVDFVFEGEYALLLEYNTQKLLKIPLPEGLFDPTLATMVSLDDMFSDEAISIESIRRTLLFRKEVWSEQIGVVNWNVIPEGMDILFDATCKDDEYEENDSIENATSLEWPILTEATICRNNDDYFKTSLVEGDELIVTVHFLHFLGNIDLIIYDPTGQKVVSSTSWTDDESLNLFALSTGEYTIHVFGPPNSTWPFYKNNYQLEIEVVRNHIDTKPNTVDEFELKFDQDTDSDTDSDTDTDTIGPGFTVLPLRKSVKSIEQAQDGNTALIIHTKKAGDPNAQGISVEERIDRSYGYSLLHPATGDLKLQLTEVEPHGQVAVPNSDTLFLLFWKKNHPAVKEVHRIDLENFVIDPIIKLESPPVSAGYVPGAKKIFVNQDHPEGRLTFIHVDTFDTQTVTGFELNSEIED